VVHDEIHPALRHPASLILARAVLQVEHRVPRTRAGVVTGRSVDERPPRRSGGPAVIPEGPHLAMRNVLRVIEIDSLFRDFHTAGGLAVSKVRLARGVVDGHTVDDQPVVVEAGDGWRRGDGPDAVVAL